jgi:tRNA-dihydrouridine synthase
VPQILANNADDFLLAASHIRELGYDEVNLNLGCPSGTVVAKKKGSGLLGEPEQLERMLDRIYEAVIAGSGTEMVKGMKVSVKTRIGKNSPDEFPELLDIFNKFPMHELIIHPRIRDDFYKNVPNMEMFKLAYEAGEKQKVSWTELCYNGDIVSKTDYTRIKQEYPDISAVMIGRGFLQNPMLAEDIVYGKSCDIKKLKEFHDLLLEGYIEVMSGEKPVLFKMKELWFYLINSFEDVEKYAKKIRKSEKLAVYKDVVEELFEVANIRLS